ncbi:unnamed protein product [Miscanthus lutarioriparius]|uniref:FAR1 domain-containing protein n=1 Tax=Miscanthus lutarioriparius TaxID=422564 RepID=A0A811QYF0_9POAL|nr:unnamed protein product [Miscanthus lutarioriparius]
MKLKATEEEMPDLDSLLEYNKIVTKKFGSETKGYLFYNKYAKGKGSSVRKSCCEWGNGHNESTLRKFVCSCECFREEKELKREIKKRKPRVGFFLMIRYELMPFPPRY